MKRTVVRYKAKPEKVEENKRLIEKVFRGTAREIARRGALSGLEIG